MNILLWFSMGNENVKTCHYVKGRKTYNTSFGKLSSHFFLTHSQRHTRLERLRKKARRWVGNTNIIHLILLRFYITFIFYTKELKSHKTLFSAVSSTIYSIRSLLLSMVIKRQHKFSPSGCGKKGYVFKRALWEVELEVERNHKEVDQRLFPFGMLFWGWFGH